MVTRKTYLHKQNKFYKFEERAGRKGDLNRVLVSTCVNSQQGINPKRGASARWILRITRAR